MFPVVLGIVKHGQHNILQESVCSALWHLKDELGKVDGVSLKEIEEMLIGLNGTKVQI